MKNYNSTSKVAAEFISHEEIQRTLQYACENKNNRPLVEKILNKAEERKGLSYEEAAVLLECDEAGLVTKIQRLAQKIKDEIYGNRIVMFAPLYLSNYCINGCTYCPYHGENTQIARKQLSQDEIRTEVTALQDMGHKRLAIEVGEDPKKSPIEYVLESIKTIYSVKHKNGDIRRVNVNIAATTVENYRKLVEAGIGTYILFQETYNKEAYEQLHPTGPKSDYAYHTEAMDRAMTGGVDDVGIGVLFGLNLYKYDFVGLLMHAEHLENTFGCGPHTISVPRIRPAADINPADFDQGLDDETFQKLIAILRIAVPYTGIIMSTREDKVMREAGLKVGVSQLSGGSRTSVGGYAEEELEADNSKQFDVNDSRTLDQVVNWLITLGHVPSFCTACYREGRTGDRFMRLAKSGEIGNICKPNALMTLKEYLEDYATADTKEMGEKIIFKEAETISNQQVKIIVQEHLTELNQGKRDFRF